MALLFLIFLGVLGLYVLMFRVYKAGFQNGLGYGVQEFDRLLRETWNKNTQRDRYDYIQKTNDTNVRLV